jgi:hypothetical protein
MYIHLMKNCLIILVSVWLSGCASTRSSSSYTDISDKQLYTNALKDACIPLEEHIYDSLTTINDSNPGLIRKRINNEEYILAVSLKSGKARTWYKNDSSGFYNTENYQIWVTVVPELKKKISPVPPSERLMRLRQLLGLPPDAVYDCIVEFWVRPQDLFRPCPDNETGDSRCGLEFPDSASREYRAWFDSSRIERYYGSGRLYSKYPWTQLGYTYDWSAQNKTHIGLSEFVIDRNKNIVIDTIYSLQDYFSDVNAAK